MSCIKIILIYLPLCDCSSIYFWELDGGLTHNSGIWDDTLSNRPVHSHHHSEPRNLLPFASDGVWVQGTESHKDGLWHSVAVWPLCRTVSPDKTPEWKKRGKSKDKKTRIYDLKCYFKTKHFVLCHFFWWLSSCVFFVYSPFCAFDAGGYNFFGCSKSTLLQVGLVTLGVNRFLFVIIPQWLPQGNDPVWLLCSHHKVIVPEADQEISQLLHGPITLHVVRADRIL